MPTFECFLRPGTHSADIEAEDAEQACRFFVQQVIENLGPDSVEVNQLDDDWDDDDWDAQEAH